MIKFGIEYISKGLINTVKLNDVVIYTYGYDENDRIIKQQYGTNSDYYTFAYNAENLLSEVYYVKNDVSVLKYSYIYDIINRPDRVTDCDGKLLYKYTYGYNNELLKLEK